MAIPGLDKEIALYQFAQGVHSEAGLLEYFSQLGERAKMNRFLELNSLVRQLKPIDSDMKQAMTDSSLTETDVSGVFPQPNQWRISIVQPMRLPEGEFDKACRLLLYLFKLAYQRRFTLGNPANWRYWDLSNPEVVQDVLTRHKEALEKVYTNASFRSEFASLAKLLYERKTITSAKRKEADPDPDRPAKFNFLSYNEMITESIKAFDDKHMRSVGVLRHSLQKALSIQYGFDAEEAGRVILEVIERHLRDTYNTDLFE